MGLVLGCELPRGVAGGGAFVEGGSVGAGTVVLLHGVGLNADAWAGQIRALSRRFHIVAPDLPGHGGSPLLRARAASLGDYAAAVARVLRAKKIGRALLVGHSLGAHIALELARAHPSLAGGVVAFGAVFRRSAVAKKAVRARATVMEREGKAAVLESTLARWREEGRGTVAAERKMRRLLEAADDDGYLAAYRVFAECDDCADIVRGIHSPVLFVAGEDDPNATPKMARALAAIAKFGEARVIKKRRHLMTLTAGGEVNKIIGGFVKRVSPPPPPPSKMGGGYEESPSKRGGTLTSPPPKIGRGIKESPLKKESSSNGEKDSAALRRAFGSFITGVTVVTAFDGEGRPRGFTANSFSSVSLRPPLVSVCVANSALGFKAFRAAKSFAVNVLGEEQRELSAKFATRSADKFDGAEWRAEKDGAPLLAGAVAWFDCAAKRGMPCGDHRILIGEVLRFCAGEGAPLGYLRGAYIRPSLERRAAEAAGDARGVVGAIVEREDSVYLCESENGGGLSLPFVSGGAEGVAELRKFLRARGLECGFSFLYSVYAREGGGTVIVYRAHWKSGRAKRGGFYPLAALPSSRIGDAAVRSLLQRFAREHESGDHPLYVGDEIGGEVHSLRIAR